MSEEFTLRFGLDYDNLINERECLSIKDKERHFAARQILILLKYVTLYRDGQRLDPNSFAIINEPDYLIKLPLFEVDPNEH